MTILFFGDIVGKPGRNALAAIIPTLRQELKPDVILANVENIAHGKGLTRGTLQEVLSTGVDIATGGDHILSKSEATELFADPSVPVALPANFPADLPSKGQRIFTVGQKRVAVINLLGQYAMSFQPVESPFAVMARWSAAPPPEVDAIIVELHAEATSEKVAMGWYLDGRVSLVAGTHTHIPTADARVLPGGTAYITDIGMVGLRDSSLGVDKDIAVKRFLTDAKIPFDIPEHGVVAVNAVLVTVVHRRAERIERIYREIEV